MSKKDERRARKAARRATGQEQQRRGKGIFHKLGRLALAGATGGASEIVHKMFNKGGGQHKQYMKDYIESRGEVPAGDDSESLLPQWEDVRNDHILEQQEAMQEGDPAEGIDPEPDASYDDAHAEILGYEAEMYGFDGENFDDPDNFFPAILAAVAKVGKGAMKGIENARAKKGKGTFWQGKKFKDNVANAKAALKPGVDNGGKGDIAEGINDAKKAYIKEEQKAWFKEHALMIGIGVVVLIGIVWYAAKGHKK